MISSSKQGNNHQARKKTLSSVPQKMDGEKSGAYVIYMHAGKAHGKGGTPLFVQGKQFYR